MSNTNGSINDPFAPDTVMRGVQQLLPKLTATPGASQNFADFFYSHTMLNALTNNSLVPVAVHVVECCRSGTLKKIGVGPPENVTRHLLDVIRKEIQEEQGLTFTGSTSYRSEEGGRFVRRMQTLHFYATAAMFGIDAFPNGQASNIFCIGVKLRYGPTPNFVHIEFDWTLDHWFGIKADQAIGLLPTLPHLPMLASDVALFEALL